MNVALVGGDLSDVAQSPLVLVPDPLLPPAQSAATQSGVNDSPAAPAAQAAAPGAPDKELAEGPRTAATIGSDAASQPKSAYPAPAQMPTQEGPKGLRFDFNNGCRLYLPEGEHPWRVQLSDLDTGNILYQTEIKAGYVSSSKRYFVRFHIEVKQQDQVILAHDYSAADQEVLIQFPVGTLGDTMGWFPYAVKFDQKHKCRLTCGMAEKLIPLYRDAYPQITFANHEQVKPERYYATYSMGLFFDDKGCVHQPCDFRYVGLHRTAGYFSASIRLRRRRSSPSLTTAGLSLSPMSASVCRVRHKPSTGIIRGAGWRSCAS